MLFNLEAKTLREAVITYLNILHRFHKLADKEAVILADLIVSYFEAYATYGNKEAAMRLYRTVDVAREIAKLNDISLATVRNYFSKLKAKKVLTEDGQINDILLPNLVVDDRGMVLDLSFNIKVPHASEQLLEGPDTGEDNPGNSEGAEPQSADSVERV